MSSIKKCYIQLTVIFEKDPDGRWLAECNELGTAMFADNFEAAKAEIIQAIELHLNTLAELGEIERFFYENGIKIKHKPTKNFNLKVPKRPNAIIYPYDYNICTEMACQ